MSHNDSMAQVREAAREKGGEELVKKVDAAAQIETKVGHGITAVMAEALSGVEEDNIDLSMAAALEALSQHFANAAVAYGEKRGVDDSRVMVMAIRSLSNSITVAMSDRDVEAQGIGDMISKAAAKGGK